MYYIIQNIYLRIQYILRASGEYPDPAAHEFIRKYGNAIKKHMCSFMVHFRYI